MATALSLSSKLPERVGADGSVVTLPVPPNQGFGGHRALPRNPEAAVASAFPASVADMPIEATDLALAVEHVLVTYRTHYARMMSSPLWSARDRAVFARLARAAEAFWHRGGTGG